MMMMMMKPLAFQPLSHSADKQFKHPSVQAFMMMMMMMIIDDDDDVQA